MNSIPVIPQLDLVHNSPIRKRLRYTLNRVHGEWTSEEIDGPVEYFQKRLLAETKDFTRSNSKNLELKFTVLNEESLVSLKTQLAEKNPFFKDMDYDFRHKCTIYRKLPDINNVDNIYKMQDVNWLNFGDFILNLVRGSQKPLVVYRGIFDMLYVS